MNPANETRAGRSTEHYIFTLGTYKLLAFTIGTIGVCGFCNNVVVIILYCRFKRLRTPTNLLLVNISLSDFLVSVIGINFTFASCVKGGWIWSQATCVWDGFSNSLFGIVSIMTLAALAYERYIRVVHAQVVDFPWAWRAIAHIWLYSLAWTGAPLLGWNRYTLEIHRLGCSLDWTSKDPNDAAFILFFLLACFFVPVGIMIYCYGNILYTVQRLRSLQDLQTVQIIKILRYEKKVAVMFLLMISCFLVCWTPYAVVSMMEAFGRKSMVSPTVAIIPSFFAKSSTAYNPLIYVFMSRKFRRCLLQLLCSRISWPQRGLKERPLAPIERPVRPIVVSSMCSSSKDRPKKRVTFNSSSIVFIITSDDFQHLDVTSKAGNSTQFNIIQVRPL
ncbi:opsin-3 [Archocentrus centrarchus]|uniref:opsin-3-like n=1 Tax=Archocentrus centrarchus TaxID=63155 RepID=UPI0011E9C485|nr:opsin-3-like [Archocentrus centrarchus]XP_030604580.1 opsin-3-like [Archocentrus centrarchus]